MTADKDLSPALFDNSQRAIFRLGQDGVLLFFTISRDSINLHISGADGRAVQDTLPERSGFGQKLRQLHYDNRVGI